MDKKNLIFKISITAALAALCFALTFVSVPLPTGAKVHLGNFVCVLSGILLGGISGGLVGSLGMGLNDIVEGYEWTTIVRTFLVKFLLGFIVGLLFRLLIKRDKATKITLYSLAGVFTVGFVGTLIAYVTGADSYAKDGSLNAGVKTHTVNLFGTSKTISFSVLVPIFMAILAAVLIGVIVALILLKLKNKKNLHVINTVATVTAISVLVNTVLEFLLRWLLKGILVGSAPALVESITKIPSNLITGVVTIIAVSIVYYPLYKALVVSGFKDSIISIDAEDDIELDDSILIAADEKSVAKEENAQTEESPKVENSVDTNDINE